jgi:hypothetical protein
MNYLITVWGDRPAAEAAYAELKSANLPLDRLAILGKGFNPSGEFSFLDPQGQNRKLARLMALWTVPFGFIAGFSFSYITGLQTFAWAGEQGDHLVGGALGAASGLLGSQFIGRGTGMILGSGEEQLTFSEKLAEGKYLVVVKGAESLTTRATDLLQPLRPVSLQRYSQDN